MPSGERILVIRLSSLGDVLLCSPALRALRKRFPEAQLDMLVANEFRSAAELLPALDGIITFDRNEGWRGLLRLRRLLSRKYEIIVDLQNSWRSAFLRQFCFPLVWVKARRYRLRRWILITFKRDVYGSVVPVPLRYLAALEQFGAQDDGAGLELRDVEPWTGAVKNRIILCPGAKHMTKQWPAERWRELARGIEGAGLEVVVCGTSDEADHCRAIADHAPTLLDAPLSEVARVMRESRAVITHDSGLMHLACACKTPVLAIFGPTVEQFGFFPFRATSRVIENSLPCRPCTAFGGTDCPQGHHDCMRRTSVNDVSSALHALLAGSSTRQSDT